MIQFLYILGSITTVSLVNDHHHTSRPSESLRSSERWRGRTNTQHSIRKEQVL